MEDLLEVLSDRGKKSEKYLEELTTEFYRPSGQLKIEMDWFKKISDSPLKKGKP